MSKPPIILRIAEYSPDMPDYMNGQCDNVLNVIPRTPTSYGPLNSPAVFGSGHANARVQGSYFGIDSSGNINGFIGTATNLQLVNASTLPTFSNVSKVPGGYNMAADDQWHFCLYGTRVIATDFADNVQSFILGSSTAFADLSAAAPKARYAATVKSYLMLGDTSDSIYGTQPQRVWWSANGDPTNWPTPSSQLAAQFESGFQDLLGEGGWVQGLVGNLGNADAVVVMQHALWRAVWVGAPAVFDFFPIEGARGCLAGGSIAQLGGMFYFLGEDGFYSNDGGASQPIGANRVDKTFFADLDQNFTYLISSAIDPVNKLYIVLYPGSGHVGSTCNKMLIYNWQLDRWSISIPIPNGGAEFIARAFSFGFTLDQLYTILGYSLDTLPYPLDSRVWTGGNLLLAIFDSAHRLNFFTGSPLAATVDTSETQPIPGQVTRVMNARPITDGNALPSVALAVRNRQQDTVSFGSAIPMNSIGTSPQRAIGRYVRAEITIPAGGSWTNISGVELEGVPSGTRG
jgi:hypothetical protein